jgi:hypothetical protein
MWSGQFANQIEADNLYKSYMARKYWDNTKETMHFTGNSKRILVQWIVELNATRGTPKGECFREVICAFLDCIEFVKFSVI